MSFVKVDVPKILFGLFCLCVLIWLIARFLKLRRYHLISEKVPSAYLNLPFIGIGYMFVGPSDLVKNRVLHLLKWNPHISKFWLGDYLMYVVNSAEYLDGIFNEVEKTFQHGLFSPVVGDGLITILSVDRWKRHRKWIAPIFNQKSMNEAVGIMSAQCEVMIKMITKEVSICNTGINVGKYFTNLAIDSVSESLFDVNLNAQIDKETYNEDLDNILKITFTRLWKVWLYVDFTFKMTKDYKIYAQIREKFSKLFKHIMDTKRKEYLDRSATEEINKTFFDILLRKMDKQQITAEEILEETNTMLGAGTDTTASSLSFICLLLAMHPEIQEKVYAEVLDVLGPDRLVCLEDFNKLQYTENVIKETLRIAPVIPLIARKLTKDVSCGDITIPQGAITFVSILSIHRNEKYWKDPLKFDPDRFLPENCAKRHPNSYIPFAGGPRNCIGSKYAKYALKVATAMLIRKFRFTSHESDMKIEDIELAINIVLKPKTTMRLNVEIR